MASAHGRWSVGFCGFVCKHTQTRTTAGHRSVPVSFGCRARVPRQHFGRSSRACKTEASRLPRSLTQTMPQANCAVRCSARCVGFRTKVPGPTHARIQAYIACNMFVAIRLRALCCFWYRQVFRRHFIFHYRPTGLSSSLPMQLPSYAQSMRNPFFSIRSALAPIEYSD